MGTVYCTKAAWPIMRKQQYGRIVVTTSGSGTVGNFGQSNYGAAKMAVNGLINVLRFEGAKYNILCNAISPSAHTRMTEGLLPPDMVKFIARIGLAGGGLAVQRGMQRVAARSSRPPPAITARVQYFQSEGVQFDPDATGHVEMVAEAFPKIMDIADPQSHADGFARLEAHLRAMGRIK